MAKVQRSERQMYFQPHPWSNQVVLTLLTEKLHHLLSAERGGPIQQRLSHVVGEIDIDRPARHGRDQSVGVLAADTIDQMSVRLVTASAAALTPAGGRARSRPARGGAAPEKRRLHLSISSKNGWTDLN